MLLNRFLYVGENITIIFSPTSFTNIRKAAKFNNSQFVVLLKGFKGYGDQKLLILIFIHFGFTAYDGQKANINSKAGLLIDFDVNTYLGDKPYFEVFLLLSNFYQFELRILHKVSINKIHLV